MFDVCVYFVICKFVSGLILWGFLFVCLFFVLFWVVVCFCFVFVVVVVVFLGGFCGLMACMKSK